MGTSPSSGCHIGSLAASSFSSCGDCSGDSSASLSNAAPPNRCCAADGYAPLPETFSSVNDALGRARTNRTVNARVSVRAYLVALDMVTSPSFSPSNFGCSGAAPPAALSSVCRGLSVAYASAAPGGDRPHHWIGATPADGDGAAPAAPPPASAPVICGSMLFPSSPVRRGDHDGAGLELKPVAPSAFAGGARLSNAHAPATIAGAVCTRETPLLPTGRQAAHLNNQHHQDLPKQQTPAWPAAADAEGGDANNVRDIQEDEALRRAVEQATNKRHYEKLQRMNPNHHHGDDDSTELSTTRGSPFDSDNEGADGLDVPNGPASSSSSSSRSTLAGSICDELAEVYLSNNQLNEARYYYERAIRFCPQSVRYAYRLGVVYQQQGRAEDATRMFSSVLALDPFNEPATFALGEAARTSGQWDKAIEYFSAIAKRNPERSQVLDLLAECHAACGQVTEAAAYVARAAELDPSNFNFKRHADEIRQMQIHMQEQQRAAPYVVIR
eukprot:GHVT01073894.1.p1 GENE.GHVT01073894.1~~GHVT01073894.1.p1  ORF type:complete len:499 (+),score=136.51 GHVT01073894.1:1251-2747(+)